MTKLSLDVTKIETGVLGEMYGLLFANRSEYTDDALVIVAKELIKRFKEVKTEIIKN